MPSQKSLNYRIGALIFMDAVLAMALVALLLLQLRGISGVIGYFSGVVGDATMPAFIILSGVFGLPVLYWLRKKVNRQLRILRENKSSE